MSKVSILTPTRDRPEMARAMMESAGPGHEFLFYVDEDDPAIYDVPIVRGPRVRLGVVWNHLARKASGDYLMMGNDDLIFRSENWAERLQEVLPPDKAGVACFDDGINGGKHFAFPIITRRWYELVGQFTAEVFTFGYHDTWIFDIAQMADKSYYIGDVLVEHIHPTVGKRPADKTFRERNWGIDPQIFEGTKQMRADIATMLLFEENE